MLSNIKQVFNVLPKVFSIVMAVITLVEMIHEAVQEGDTNGEDKHQEAAKRIKNILGDAIEKGFLPSWADIFMDEALLDWLIRQMVRIAEWQGFFEREQA